MGPGLYVVAPDGTGVRRLVAGYGMHSWSPDGSRLAWSNAIAPTWSSDGRLAVIGTKTIEPGTLLHLTLQLVEPGGGLRMVFDAGDGFSVQSPAWSPTGRLLAVSVGTERLSGLVSR